MAQSETAQAVIYKGIGGEEVIELGERTVRAPGAGEIRIKVQAAAVNPTDIVLRDPGREGVPQPVTPGMDAAGVVEAVGSGVTRLKVGDAVMAVATPSRPDGGAQAALLVVPEASAVPIPDGTTVIEASTLPMNGLTALLALDLAALKPGQTLAVSGGAGLLGHYAIAAAKHRGLRVVADAKASELEAVRRHGADVVVERSEDFSGAVLREVPDGVDALLDTALLGEKGFAAIRDGGVYLPVRAYKGPDADRGIAIKPVWVFGVLERTDWLNELRDLVTSGKIKLRVAGEFPPWEVGAAQRILSAGGLRGRTVIVF